MKKFIIFDTIFNSLHEFTFYTNRKIILQVILKGNYHWIPFRAMTIQEKLKYLTFRKKR
jgi:hypothetical protein